VAANAADLAVDVVAVDAAVVDAAVEVAVVVKSVAVAVPLSDRSPVRRSRANRSLR